MSKLILAVLLVTLTVLGLLSPSYADSARVNDARVWPAPDGSRLIFDLNQSLKYKVFRLSNPERVVIDFKKTRLLTRLKSLDLSKSSIKRIRSGKRNGKDLRIVLDMKETVSPKSALLRPNSEYGFRLVLDLDRVKQKSHRSLESRLTQQKNKENQDIVVAIDAGHGGEDPGARGRRGTKEKDIVLKIARELKRMFDQQKGMKGVLIRSGDYYLDLRKRMKIARQHRADFFISIHADAFHDPRARGSSVYSLSSRGENSEAARWLAKKANNADLIGGVQLANKDDMVASMLLDMAQSATRKASYKAARNILHELKGVGKVHSKTVQSASFVVLKSPDIPSVLVETAYISNPSEEKKLQTKTYQKAIAKAIFNGVYRYFNRSPPTGSLLARNRHTIAQGETLGEIALYYRVSIKKLKVANNLRSDKIISGQVLRIPIDSTQPKAI
ncbi:N-acetylmuramoyl-L-alanine amidase [hydrothermal vent metagenome]|uniref:N-acetylmuramoyl-L-alanine amidase n=1 Tax=hydrothermal vent metagenome TaxID=652676 RepID=A0A3B0ZVF0_9ZZZZ